MTDDARVSLSMIVRDEAANLEALLSSVRRHVDEIVVVDTGSTDGTLEIARRYADRLEVFTGCNDDEGRIADFSAARNRALSLCSHDWMLWLDGDDLLGGFPSAVKDIARETDAREPMAVLAPYEYSYAEDGSVSCLLWRERMVWPRSEFEWTGPVHETLGRRDGKAAGVRTQSFHIKHARQFHGKPADPGRNLRILERHVGRVGITDPRSVYYLGVEYAAAGRHAEAARELERAAELEGWDDARCAALLAAARSYDALDQPERAVEAASRAAQEKSWPEPYFVMHEVHARRATTEREWCRAAHFARLGLALAAEREDGLLPSDPSDVARARAGLTECLRHVGGRWAAPLSLPLGRPAPTAPATLTQEQVKARVVSDLRSLGVDLVDLQVVPRQAPTSPGPPVFVSRLGVVPGVVGP